tara:strand:+ start:673 stop:858 length:186 start_codon:yes stop_codon:yes gene_type:complete
MSSSEEIQVNDKEPLFETKLGCALLLSYKKEISSIMMSFDVQDNKLKKEKIIRHFFILQHF